jgi:hypothetical protein
VNDAARKAGDWQIAFIADCDTIPEHENVLRAVAWVQSTGGGARPHMRRYMLTAQGTLTAVQRGVETLQSPPSADFDRRQWDGGGLDVVTREAFDAVGGFDERYEYGWGYEDSEFHVQLIAHRRWERLPGEAWHLHHDTSGNKADPRTVQLYRQTVKRYKPQLDRWAFNQGLMKPMSVF